MRELAALAVAFALGAFPTAVLWGRARGVDVTRQGSGNPGAANVYRLLGARAGVCVLLADVAKGLLAVASARWLDVGEMTQVAAGTASVAGHIVGPFSGCRGGKGMATACGAFLVLAPLATAVAAFVWALTIGLTRFVSLASMLGATSLPLAVGVSEGWAPTPTVCAALAIAALVLVRHRSNLARLVAGREPRFSLHGGNPGTGGSHPSGGTPVEEKSA